MKIPKDNLTPIQKKKAYLKILALGIIITLFVIYRIYDKKERDLFLSSNTEITNGKIIGYTSTKITSNIVEYFVNGKKYKTGELSSRLFNIGEQYEVRYSKNNPKISETNYAKPIIEKKSNYETIKASVTNIYKSKKMNLLSFSYKYNGIKYKREIFIENIDLFKENMVIDIIVNKSNPKISYLKL